MFGNFGNGGFGTIVVILEEVEKIGSEEAILIKVRKNTFINSKDYSIMNTNRGERE